jgi:hypothetical protein
MAAIELEFCSVLTLLVRSWAHIVLQYALRLPSGLFFPRFGTMMSLNIIATAECDLSSKALREVLDHVLLGRGGRVAEYPAQDPAEACLRAGAKVDESETTAD